MNTRTKIYILYLVSAVVFFTSIEESCAATVPAANCSFSAVSAAVGSAAVGDTVTVPTGTCTWNSTLNINKGITLKGSGIGNTIIKKGTDPLIQYQPSNPNTNALIRITGFTFDHNMARGNALYVSSGNTLVLQTRLRIDHNRFQNIPTDSTQDHYIYYAGMRGVIDNNVFGRVFYPFRTPGSPINLGAPNYAGGAEWNNFEGVVLGKADNNIYFEDNIFEQLYSGGGVAMTDCQQGQRYAFRYNTINIPPPGSGQSLFDMHGNQGSTFYSCMGGEIYGNDINGTGTIVDHRGGRAFVFYNKTNGGSIQIREEFADSISPVSNSSQYPQHVNGSYYWENRDGFTGPLISIYLNTTCSWCYQNGLRENVDFWKQGSSFNGTSGIGCGTLAARPSTCTNGVGYWATNQSCTNLTGMVGAHPATPISGTFYRCTSAGKWDAGASPLPYPHPLIAESEKGATLPPPLIAPLLHAP